MNWGILGTGAIAAQFAEALARVPGARLTAVGSRDPARARAFGAPRGAGLVAADAADLARFAEVDVVYVATPNHRHEADALAVIAAGKPVLVEKPLATDAEAARRVAEAARARGVFAMEGLWSLCLPAYREAFDRIARGEIGALRGMSGSFCVPVAHDPASRFWDPAQGGGALLDRGIYLVALALALFDDPRPVWAAARRAPSGVDAATDFVLADARGRHAVLSVALDAYGPNEVALSGAAGRCVFLEPITNPPGYWLRARAPLVPAPVAAAPGRKARLVAVLRRQGALRRLGRGLMRGARWPAGGLEHEIAEVERCLRARLTESPLVPLDRSVRALEILDEIAALAGSGS